MIELYDRYSQESRDLHESLVRYWSFSTWSSHRCRWFSS